MSSTSCRAAAQTAAPVRTERIVLDNTRAQFTAAQLEFLSQLVMAIDARAGDIATEVATAISNRPRPFITVQRQKDTK